MFSRRAAVTDDLTALLLVVQRARKPRVLLYPAIQRGWLDEQELSARDHPYERLDVPLEVSNADAEGCSRLGSCKQAAGNWFDRAISGSSCHLFDSSRPYASSR
jgi:hypothetical protein